MIHHQHHCHRHVTATSPPHAPREQPDVLNDCAINLELEQMYTVNRAAYFNYGLLINYLLIQFIKYA